VGEEQLPHLETFARAAELSSFTACARALGLTQAAVSQRIAALEQELGVSLFRRQGGRVLLTDEGRRLHGYAQRIRELHRQARQEVSGKPVPLTGELSLAASSVPGEHLLPELLAAFRQRSPTSRCGRRKPTARPCWSRSSAGRPTWGWWGAGATAPT
jgi:DNA-binding transcriptional LysR family regulator